VARLFLLFTLVPVIELWLLIEIGSRVGAIPTIAVVVITGMLGAWLARREGLRAMRGLQEAMARGEMPANQVVVGFLIVVGGDFLVTPGVLTDVVGFALLIPLSRARIKKWVVRYIEGRVAHQATVVTSSAPLGQANSMPESPVVDATFEPKDKR
jgi:UPF0716 protein FxsA